MVSDRANPMLTSEPVIANTTAVIAIWVSRSPNVETTCAAQSSL